MMSEAEERSVEDQARELGWKSPEEWVGDPPPKGFQSADAFMNHNSKLRDDLASTRSEIAEMRSTFDEFSQFHKETVANQYKAGYQRARNEIVERQKQAIEDSDSEAFEQAEKQKAQLAKQEQEQLAKLDKPTTDADIDRMVTSFKQDNEWFDTDYQLRNEMKLAGDMVEAHAREKGENLTPKDLLTRSRDLVAKKFPDHDAFRTDRVPDYDGGNRQTSGGRSQVKGWANIPPEDQRVGQKFVDQGLMTQEEYVQEYFSNDE